MIRTVTILIMTVTSLGSGTPRAVSLTGVLKDEEVGDAWTLKQAGFGENGKGHGRWRAQP